MGLILWIIFGGIIGWIASMLMKTGGGVLLDIVVGIVGAVVGGWIMALVGGTGITGINVYSFVVALIGAIVFLGVIRLFRRGATR